MPTYEYRCDGCGHEFEVFQSITDSRLRKCPRCGKRKLRRLIGPGSAVIFRGSGFYSTDYRKGSAPKDSETAPSESSDEAAKPETSGAGEQED